MKLRLPKQLLTAMLAAVCALPVAWASTTLNGLTYSGNVYTWGNTDTQQKDLAYGPWIETTENDGQINYGTSHTEWTGDIIAIIANNGKKVFSNVELNTFRFDGDKGSNSSMKYTFEPLSVAGFIVETTATDYSITAGNGNRAVYIGNGNGTAARSDIKANFTLNTNGQGAITLQGTQTWNIADGVTYTLNSGNSAKTNSGSLTLDGTGKVLLQGNGAFTNEGTLDLGTAKLTKEGTGAFTNTGTLTIGSGTLMLGGGNLLNNGILKLGDNAVSFAEGTSMIGTGSVSGTKNQLSQITGHFGTTWTGTTVLSNESGWANLNLNTYTNGGKASVQLIGVSGHFASGTNNALTIGGNVILGNLTGDSVDAFTHTDGYSNTIYTFSGKVSGTGNMVANRANGTTQTVFAGDVTEWTGAYKNTNGQTSELTFTGNATAVNATITKTAGTLNLTVKNSEHTAFAENVTVNKLVISGNGGVGFAKDLTVSGAVETDGTISYGGRLSISGNITMTAGSGIYEKAGDLESGRWSDGTAGQGVWLTTKNYLLKNTGTGSISGSLNISTPNGLDVRNDGNGNYIFDGWGEGQATYVFNSSATYQTITDGYVSLASKLDLAENVTLTATGEQLKGKTLVLRSGAVVKSSDATSFNTQQIQQLELLGNAALDTTGGNIGLIAADSGATALVLNNNTLNITGSHHFALFSTTVDAGTLAVANGSYLQVGHSGKQTTAQAGDTLVSMNSGFLTIDNSSTLTVEGLTGKGSITCDGGTPNLIIHADRSETPYTFEGALGTNGLNLTMAAGSTGTQNIQLTADATLGTITMNNGTLNFSKAEGTEAAAMTVGNIVMPGGSTNATLTFDQKVTLTNNNPVTISGSGNEVHFDGGMDYTGTGGNYTYALVISNGAKVYFGAETDLSDFRIGQASGTEVIVQSGADLKVMGMYNSTGTPSSNGAVTIENGANFETVNQGMLASVFTNAGTSVIKGSNLNITSKLDNSGDLTFYNSGNLNSITQTGRQAVLRLKNGVSLTTKLASGGSVQGRIELEGNAELTLKELGSGNAVSLKDLVLGSGSLSAYTGTVVSEDEEASVIVDGLLSAATGATLNANLTVDNGAKLDITGENGLIMGSSVKLGNSITLSDDMLTALENNQVVILFTGVDSLTLGSGTPTSAAITLADAVDASQFFTNLPTSVSGVETKFYITYSGSDENGVVSISVPEPATATLSLLALAAMAARRRRK